MLFLQKKKAIMQANVLKKRNQKLVLVLATFTLVITAKKMASENSKYLRRNFEQVPCIWYFIIF